MLTRLFYPHIGGVERHVGEINKRLVKKGHRVTVVTERIKETKESEIVEGINVLRIPYPKIRFLGLLYIWLWFLKNRSLINQSDIIHCHDVFIWYLPMRFFSSKKPVYVTFHGYEGSEPPTRRAIFHHKLAERLSWGNLCIGDFHKKWYRVKPTFVSYGGVEEKDIKTTSKRDKTAVFIGRLSKDTGILLYIKALVSLKKQGITLSLDIFGDGPQREEAEKLAQNYDLACRFHGFVREVDKKLRQFRFAFVSRYLAILEAMVVKKLVFAVFDDQIKRDYLKMAPFAKWIIIESNPKKLSEKIKYYLNHPEEEEKLLEKAYNWAKKKSWDKVVELYLKLWREK